MIFRASALSGCSRATIGGDDAVEMCGAVDALPYLFGDGEVRDSFLTNVVLDLIQCNRFFEFLPAP